MTPPRSPARRAIDAVLADGAPHTRDELLEAAARTVPPGRAYRRAEAQRMSNQRSRTGAAEARQRGDEDTATGSGARKIAWDALRSATRWGGSVVRLPDGTYQAAPR